jgi:SAM-dependent methyltransferase
VPDADPWDGLEAAYLAGADARAQSGFRGDDARWTRGRRCISDAIDRDGTFLDIGCANGLLMESMTNWCAQRGHAIEPFGLDVSLPLIQLARERLPQWTDRFFVGDARTWAPPPGVRFDFVRTELVYARPEERPALVAHLRSRVVAPNGRLIVCAYGAASKGVETVERITGPLRAWGHAVAGETQSEDSNGVVFTRVAWIDGPAR